MFALCVGAASIHPSPSLFRGDAVPQLLFLGSEAANVPTKLFLLLFEALDDPQVDFNLRSAAGFIRDSAPLDLLTASAALVSANPNADGLMIHGQMELSLPM